MSENVRLAALLGNGESAPIPGPESLRPPVEGEAWLRESACARPVPEHILVLYENSPRGAAAMEQAAEAAAQADASLTVVVVAVTEKRGRGLL